MLLCVLLFYVAFMELFQHKEVHGGAIKPPFEKETYADWVDLGLWRVKTPPIELNMINCEYLLCPEGGLLPRGVVYTAYSTDKELMAKKLLPEAFASAASFKEFHGNGSIPTCLISNAPAELVDGNIFNYIIRVRSDLLFAGAERGPGYNPQWFTRLLYLASSPFQTTLSVDGNVGFVGTSTNNLKPWSRMTSLSQVL